MNNYEKIFETIVEKTYQYLTDNKRKAMILGISGGIDSTVTAAVCSEINRQHPEIRFIGVSLPCSTNSQEERDSASKAMRAFCDYTASIEHNLQKEFSMIRESFANDYNWLKVEETKLALGNIKARMRMMYLYNLASLTDGLVMDTDNLTEYYLGFWTIHGDVGDFNPIGGLWKHEIYGLAKWLANEYYHTFPEQLQISASEKINALRAAIVITPTDGNGVKVGGDLAQIAPGHTYNDVDDILMTYISCKEQHPDEWTNARYVLDDKYGADTVDMVIKRHINSEFKRKRLPIAIERKEYEEHISDKFEN